MGMVTKVFAGLAALLHVLFFTLESVIWGTETANKIFKQTPETAEITRLLAFNQGFYNLFLAVGVVMGFVLLAKGKREVGTTLVIFPCFCMLGAALVLVGSSPSLIKGALIQGVPPLVAIGTWFFCSRTASAQKCHPELDSGSR